MDDKTPTSQTWTTPAVVDLDSSAADAQLSTPAVASDGVVFYTGTS